MWGFTFKGESSRDYGITVNRRAPRQTANTRTVLTEIDGRDGAVIEKVGYNTYTMNMQITVQGKDNLHRISSWLKGEGKFTRSDIEGRYLLVKHESEIEFTMISNNLYTSQITFQVMYPKWLKEDSWSRPWGANLIPNGWDSFQPYGSGVNYVENWNFETGDLSGWGGAYGTHTIHNGIYVKTITDKSGTGRAEYAKTINEGNYIVRVKIRSNKKVFMRNWTNVQESPERLFGSSESFEVHEYGIRVISSTETTRIRFYVESEKESIGQTFEIDWIQITPINDQHLVVEKTPLGNGLTRIQTWGGNERIKIRRLDPKSLEVGKTYSLTIYSPSSYGGECYIYGNLGGLTNREKLGAGFVNIVKTDTDSTMSNVIITGTNINDSLDFIASDPIIVEGDTPPTWEADENPRIVNEGNTTSQPIIKIIKNKEEKLDVVINGTRLIYEFDNSKYIDIDCYTQEVTDDQGLSKARNLKIGYEFPELKPGDNVVQVLSGDATILFRRKDAWK